MGKLGILSVLTLAPLLSLAAPISFTGYGVEAVGIYGAKPGSLQEIKALGMNTVVLDAGLMSAKELEAMLEEAQALDLKVLLQKTPFEHRGFISFVQDYADHPSIRYWNVSHEPDLNNVDPLTVEMLSNLAHSNDRGHKRSTLVSLSNFKYAPDKTNHPEIYGKSFGPYKNSADILIIDVASSLHPSRGKTDHEKDIPSAKEISQFLNKQVASDLADVQWWAVVSLRLGPESFKRSVQAVLEAGAGGILYYNYQDGYFQENKDLQTLVKDINTQIQTAPPPGVSAVGSLNRSATFPGAPIGDPTQVQAQQWVEQMQRQQQQTPPGTPTGK